MRPSRLLLLFFCLLISQSVFALRCGHELVELGNSKNDVVYKCGDPDSIDTHLERRSVSHYSSESNYFGDGATVYPNTATNIGLQQYAEVDVVVEEWVYDFGRRRLQQYLRFENGRLKELKTLDRGH
ncbi:DUF2845 domain-containing protein [Methylovulum psychrotolerans]|uniref:DUF2845 domain-containing protein n=1 Tax=Methylovulum psychrotolerans TaxID=1704499 RepID=UPI001BFEFCDD|nr:DUF2845 domain-containing protein [Methylovulum psychrotolerans]MBT9097014.1 DUF2845 domain-containing protein [Methylovulum psychrotolerans]